MTMNGVNAPLKSTFSHGLVGSCCQWWDPTTQKKRKGRGTLVWEQSHCVISYCAARWFVCTSTNSTQTPPRWENRLLLKSTLKWMIPFQMQAWEKQDFLLLDSDWGRFGPVPSAISGSWLFSSAFVKGTFSFFGCTIIFWIYSPIFGLSPWSP